MLQKDAMTPSLLSEPTPQVVAAQPPRLVGSTRLRGLVGRQEPTDLGQEGRRHGHDGLVLALRRRRLVRGDPLLLGPGVEFRQQLAHAVLVPAGREALLAHLPRLLFRFRLRYALSSRPASE